MRWCTVAQLLCWCVLLSPVSAVEVAPWLSRPYEIFAELENKGLYYRRLSSKESCRQPAFDYLMDLSLQASNKEGWNGALALGLGTATERGFATNDIRGMVRRQLSDDVVGNLISSVAGATVGYTFPHGRRDIGVFFPEGLFCELHLSLGKEVTEASSWLWRTWAFVAVGQALHGSPWLRGRLALEGNFCDSLHSSLFLDCAYAFGNSRLHPCHFSGYGSLAYRSLDLFLQLRYFYESGAYVTFRVGQRLLGCQAPRDATFCAFAFTYPFGL